jgi:hypothetical protein
MQISIISFLECHSEKQKTVVHIFLIFLLLIEKGSSRIIISIEI